MSMLSSALGKLGIGKGVQNLGVTMLGTAIGGPIGGLIGAATAASKSPSPFTGVVPPGNNPAINSIFQLGPSAPMQGVVGGSSSTAQTGGGCPRGYHLNKHALPASRSHGAVGPRQICVRNRHVNALNGRAAQRALRRLKRVDKMTRKIHHLFHRTTRKAPARKR